MTTVSAAQQNVVTTHANATLYFAAISGESRYLTSTTFIHITIHSANAAILNKLFIHMA